VEGYGAGEDVMRYRLHGVHGYRLGRHWNIVYEIAALFYRVGLTIRSGRFHTS
jgi:hypothetical protein